MTALSSVGYVVSEQKGRACLAKATDSTSASVLFAKCTCQDQTEGVSEMTVLTIMRGVSGSGKSTIARAQPDSVVVSRDDLRAALFGSDGPDYHSVPKPLLKVREDTVTEAEHAAIRAALRAGLNVISDNTNVRMQNVNPIAAIGYTEGAEVKVNLVDVPLATAIERNRMRASMGGRNVPEDVIRKQYDALQSSKHREPKRPHVPTAYEGTPGKPKAFLVDIDGTLAHRTCTIHP